jgi:hypothetical protein
MEKKDTLFNYVLSLGFILFLFLFLISLVMLSRFVLSDNNSNIQTVVSSTQDLLEEVETVTKNAEKNTNLESLSYVPFDVSLKKLGVIDSVYLNINSRGISYVTLTINSTIEEYKGYGIIKNEELLSKGTHIIYQEDNTGIILSNNDDSFKVFDDEKLEVVEITKEDIIGIIILKLDKDEK